MILPLAAAASALFVHPAFIDMVSTIGVLRARRVGALASGSWFA